MDRVSSSNFQTIGGRRTWLDKNPAGGVPYGTTWSAVWAAGVQESIVEAIEAAGLTPADSALGAIDTQLTQAISILGGRATGQCRLSAVSASSLVLSPFNGNTLRINGVPVSIPAAGVAIANTGLTAATLYYVYAYLNAGALALELSVTVPAISTLDGTKIRSADATRALVGMVYTGAGTPGTFVDTTVARGVSSYFNRRARNLTGASTGGAGTASTTPVELTGTARVTTLVWGDDDVALSIIGNAFNNTSADGFSVYIGIDGAIQGLTSSGYSAVGGQSTGTTASFFGTLSEGVHTLSPFGQALVGGTAFFITQIYCGVRI